MRRLDASLVGIFMEEVEDDEGNHLDGLSRRREDDGRSYDGGVAMDARSRARDQLWEMMERGSG